VSLLGQVFLYTLIPVAATIAGGVLAAYRTPRKGKTGEERGYVRPGEIQSALMGLMREARGDVPRAGRERQEKGVLRMIGGQRVPVRVYTTDDHVMLAAPMPGLEPPDVSVSIGEGSVTLRGKERGPGQHGRELLLAEWTIGPYEREVELPTAVNGDLANATYGNGVLVVSMPKVPPGQDDVPAEFGLETVGEARGERVGHAGRENRPHTTEEHLRDRGESRR
jgi:HSP20 family protein